MTDLEAAASKLMDGSDISPNSCMDYEDALQNVLEECSSAADPVFLPTGAW